MRAFLASLADEIEAADAERAALRAELDRLRAESADAKPRSEINAHAVALFSQAQQVADRLVAEAVQHARELMMTAREQQREILEKAHEEAQRAAAKVAAPGAFDPQVVFADETDPGPGSLPGGFPGAAAYGRQIPEIEYVRTFARVAQVQLKSVLDALTEQVEQLGRLPNLPESPAHELPPGSRLLVEPKNDDPFS